MKIKFFIVFSVLFVSVLSFWGCSGDPVSNSPDTTSSGGIILKIDKSNAPADVAIVTASLTRTGFQPINASMNLLSDTSATLSLNLIPVGEWHLKVEAKNNQMLTLYSGETDVTIQDGIIIQVSLTLLPVSQGVGGIEILVTWGSGITPPSNWVDFPGNPLLSQQNLWWEFGGLFHPKIIYDGNGYKMYFVGVANASLSHTGYAVSTDGISWTRPSSLPILFPGNPGTWDSQAAQAGAIIKEETGYKMYYVGWSDPYKAWNIGMATSSDGINWTKRQLPVIYSSSGWEYQIVPFSVIKVNNLYYLYYTGRSSNNKIGLATSEDGVNWIKHPGKPILTAGVAWEGSGVMGGSVLQTDQGFTLVYSGQKDDAFGLAHSPDGKTWIKDPANPVFRKNFTAKGWGSYQIAYPHLTVINNQQVIFYSATNSSYSPFKIGMIKKIN